MHLPLNDLTKKFLTFMNEYRDRPLARCFIRTTDGSVPPFKDGDQVVEVPEGSYYLDGLAMYKAFLAGYNYAHNERDNSVTIVSVHPTAPALNCCPSVFPVRSDE
jgi:hypothetical protein